MSEVEHILVVPASVLDSLGRFQGLLQNVDRYVPAVLHCEEAEFRPRPEMERDPGYKQLIPYVIFRHVLGGRVVGVFAYTRSKKQGEERLHLKRSIGVGGHISAADEVGERGQYWTTKAYAAGLRRELDEEVVIGADVRVIEQHVGLLNDDSTEVGKVHLGVVHFFDVSPPNVTAKDPEEMLEARFYTPAVLLADFDNFESWSQFCLQALFTTA